MILGEDLIGEDRKVSRIYRDVEFSTEYLHIPYSEFMELPRWERKMYEVYLDIKTRRQQKEDEKVELEAREAKTAGEPKGDN